MTELLVLSRPDNLTTVAQAWDRLRKDLPYFFPDFESAAFLLSDAKRDFRVLAIKNGDQITCLACFVYGPAMKPFKLGERKLFSVPVREVRLFGSAILGTSMTRYLVNLSMLFGRLLISILFRLDTSYLIQPCMAPLIRGEQVSSRPVLRAKTSIRWLINLPRTFDEYLAQLSSNSAARGEAEDA